MHAKSDSYTISCRSAARPYPKHGRRRIPAPMRSPCIHLYDHSFFRGFSQEFSFISASVCDSRNWNSQSNSFGRAPSSGGGSNAPHPAVSAPHLDVNADRRRARQAKSAFILVLWAVYARAILGSWHIYVELERIYIRDNIFE